MTTVRRQVERRRRQVRTLLRTVGVRGLLSKALLAGAHRLQAPQRFAGVRDVDVLDADIESAPHGVWSPRSTGEHFTINWVMTAPHERSGGHTTAFRLIRHLQDRGHRCRVHLYDVYGGDFAYHRAIVQDTFANSSTEVFDVFDGLHDADAIFATSWETAYPVFNSTAAGRRFYLVQDYEPWFSPRGSTAVLAENTYRMGFHGITAGQWLPTILADRFGMRADGFAFGCDTDVYRLGSQRRDGVVFYARRSAPRRAFELGVLALELFHRRHPDITIHCYGDKVGPLRFPFVDHGVIPPEELNEIYNRCFAGLSLSTTNVSLVPHEMLAAGCIPVVNDAEHNRVVLDNAHVRYALATPHALSRALSEVVSTGDFEQLSSTAATSVATASWSDAGRLLESVLDRELRQFAGGTVPPLDHVLLDHTLPGNPELNDVIGP
jgi:glycosyltransferase involved in cell wall biosynthesis